jgi:MoxR-like ATPase
MVDTAVRSVSVLTDSLRQVIRGREDTIKLALTGLIADGHVLIEDYPGSGKTTLAKTLGRSIDCSAPVQSRSSEYSQVSTSHNHIVPFRRIQFTPDLLPSDVLGVTVFEPKSGSFRFQHGPIFAHVLLADEINRTGPKVQAAFLECMAERQVTIDNVTHPLDEMFFVIGTQNPLDLAGTYPLPLVQLDRFLLRIPMRYVTPDVELEILKDAESIQQLSTDVHPVVSRQEILHARRVAASCHIDEAILKAVVDLVQSTRNSPLLHFGASTRSAIMLRKALGAWALLEGRDFATEDDLKTIAPFVLLHRLRFHPGVASTQDAFAELLLPVIEKLGTGKYR